MRWAVAVLAVALQVAPACPIAAAPSHSPDPAGAAAQPSLVISRDTPLVVTPGDLADSALALALADLRRDFYAVFGSPPVVLRHLPDGPGAVIVLGAAGQALLPEGDRCTAEAEAHCVVLQGSRLIATGAPASLGAVFGLYALSEVVLGVVPLHHFAELPPQRRRTIAVPGSLALRLEARGWETRAVFVNDEDLTAGFGPDPLGDGIGAETYNRIYEALLRLKANGVISGTANFPDQRGGTTLAAKRGLRILQHHVTPVGLNVMRWPNSPAIAEGGVIGLSAGGAPFSFLNSPAVLEHAWAASIDGLLGALPTAINVTRAVQWTVGLRGLNDYPWWQDSKGDERVANSTLRGAVIGEAMEMQLQLIRQRDPNAEAVAYMWSEMLALWTAGSLKVPAGVTVVFADGGGGKIQGLDAVRSGDGLYYHVSDRGNQLSEWVPVSTVLSQLSQFFANSKRPTGSGTRASVFILNASDLKPYLLSLAAALAFAFDPIVVGTDASAFIARWTQQHYGAAAPAVAAVHEGYELQVGKATSDYGLVIAVQNLAVAMLSLAEAQRGTGKSFNFSSLEAGAAVLQRSSAATVSGWRALSAQAEAVALPPHARQMFTGHCLAQHYLLGNGTLALNQLAGAALALSDEDRRGAMLAAVAAMEAALDGLQLAEGAGQWKGYFAHDRLDDFQHSRRLLMQLLAAVDRTGATAMHPRTYTRPICSCTGGVHNCSGSIPYQLCPDLFANQLPPHYAPDAFPLLYRSATSALTFDGVVRGGCRGACETTPSGGLIHRGDGDATAWLALPAGVRGQVRFTLDRSLPTARSQVYTSPLSLQGNRTVTVTAKAFGVPAGVVSPPSVFVYFPSSG